MRCGDGHRADVARQGFVTLSRGGILHPGDTAPMVMARERVQSSGMFDALKDAIVRAVPESASTVLDLGAGTGFYAAAVLGAPATLDPAAALDASATLDADATLDAAVLDADAPLDATAVHGHHGPRRGLAVESSKPALRRAARAHPRLGALGADLTAPLPIPDASIDVCLVVFAPRPAAEIARVLRPAGVAIVVTPNPGHLAAVVEPMGMLSVPRAKVDAVVSQFGPDFTCATSQVQQTSTVDASLLADLALMGPAGFHASAEELISRAGALLPEGQTIEVSVDVSVSSLST